MESKPVKVGAKVINYFYVLRFCVAFSLIYEIFSKVFKLSLQKHELLLHGSSDPKKFLIAYTATAILGILGDLSLALCHLVFKARNRKRLLLHIVAINVIIIVPVGGSGVYLALKERSITPDFSWKGHYDHIAEHLPDSNATSTLNESSIAWNETRFSSTKMNDILFSLDDIQSSFDCCLSGKNETDSLIIDFDLQLLSNCSNRNITRKDRTKWRKQWSCPEGFTSIWRTILILSSCSLLISSVLFILVSPFIYALFEFDARQERFHKITRWQAKTRRELEEERKQPEVTEVKDERQQLIQEISSI